MESSNNTFSVSTPIPEISHQQNIAIDVSSQGNTQRRSSSRSIRRKKFDDELVEYSSRIESSTTPVPGSSKTMRIRTHSAPSVSAPDTPLSSVMSLALPRRATARSRGRSRHSRHSVSATKDLGRWKPTDDLALILSVLQTAGDLRMVERGVKFSCRFTYQEIFQRWQALLHDPVVSRVAMAAIRNLHPDIVADVRSKALFSTSEEELLAAIKSTENPTLETFQNLLQNHPQVFHHSRTDKVLHTHWCLMRQYHLLKDQTIQATPTFSDAEDNLNDAELTEPRDEAVERELMLADRRAKQEIRSLEEELSRLQVLVDSVPGGNYADFDNQTLAVLRGKMVRYLMRSKEVTVGRCAKDHTVDIDLSLEGPAFKVSRRQGTIRLRYNGDFFISSEGKRPIFVDGRPVLCGSKHRLSNNAVIEISGLRFIFQINQDLVNCIRQEAAKHNVQS